MIMFINKKSLKYALALVLNVCLAANRLNAQPWAVHGKLVVSSQNPWYIQYSDGAPFFWLGDTGWEMLHLLNRQDIAAYLSVRSKQGYNVIQTVLVSEFIHSNKETDTYHFHKETNFYNDSIFVNEDPEKPLVTPGNDTSNAEEYDYWDNVDFAVATAEKAGIYLALLPTWGEWVTPRNGNPLFNTTKQAYDYGWFLGNRYKRAHNIIWMLGGDRLPDERDSGIAIWRAMAEGITDGTNGEKKQDGKADYSATFMTWHSFQSSSNWFSKDAWIDVNGWGSYHSDVNNPHAYEAALADRKSSYPKPSLNLEPCYEGGSINYGLQDNGYFTSVDVRMAAYWGVFSGTAGITYGANLIWQFAAKDNNNVAPGSPDNWKDALNLKGAIQLTYLKKLMLSRSFRNLTPDSTMLVSGQGDRENHTAVLLGNSHAFVYIPSGNDIRIKLGIISGKKIKASWFNPRTCEFTSIGEFENTGEKSFKVPPVSKELAWLNTGRGCDWVLVLDDANFKEKTY